MADPAPLHPEELIERAQRLPLEQFPHVAVVAKVAEIAPGFSASDSLDWAAMMTLRAEAAEAVAADLAAALTSVQAEADRKVAARVALADSENPTVQALTGRVEELETSLEVERRHNGERNEALARMQEEGLEWKTLAEDLTERLEAVEAERDTWKGRFERAVEERAEADFAAAATSREEALREAIEEAKRRLANLASHHKKYREGQVVLDKFAAEDAATTITKILDAALATTPEPPPAPELVDVGGPFENVDGGPVALDAAPPSSSREEPSRPQVVYGRCPNCNLRVPVTVEAPNAE